VVGGGFSIKGGFGIVLDSSPYGKSSWLAIDTNSPLISKREMGTLQAHAECAKFGATVSRR
jgi:hypothetical protein